MLAASGRAWTMLIIQKNAEALNPLLKCVRIPPVQCIIILVLVQDAVLGAVVVTPTRFSAWGGFLQTLLLSALKFVGCWFLEERNPRPHHVFRDVETCLRQL